MFKHSVIKVVVASFMAILFGCTTESSSAVSPATAETELELQSIAPGVSVGDHANQHIVYVSDKIGADWLRSSAQQEYNTLLDQYTTLGDDSLLPRLSYLQATLRATDANSGSAFTITSVDENLVGPSCSAGDGSTCSCSSGCFCISADLGCSCDCSGKQQ